ncbi:SAM-dependent methyltransferase [Pseudalkalibacillus salsuginis]|uniref:SAM-dependent methyltransferase n=1 Tax=Pseudalkalibacillus salsuginis TaxID=2910972 RepID=UPI001F3A6D58|nr:SAM-dependent methyltransferase [Pseudalkalibacillus salsuginis]MCF6408454.1 SAM-dependent methyltransferase [Pseudalkalibacillus salsuginis]
MKKEQLTIEEALYGRIQSTEDQRISYADYMETVLYHQAGYYQKEDTKIGKEGDFYTSSSIHPVFAWVFADYFDKYCRDHELPFHICEIGGGNGTFTKQVLDYLKGTKPVRYREIIFSFIDVSQDHLKTAQMNLSDHENIKYYSSLSTFQKDNIGFKGIIFSNELLDAFPVHVVEKREDAIHEVKLTLDKWYTLKEVLDPAVNNELLQWLEWSGIELPEKHRFEVPLKMMNWLSDMAKLLKSGLVVTVDYGYKNDELLDPALRNGSLRGYLDHQLIENPLSYPGQMDLTTHIQLDALIKKGGQLGLQNRYVGKQRDFLLENGLFNHLVEHDNRNPFSEENRLNRAIRSFVTPGGISDAFYVIVQEKGR